VASLGSIGELDRAQRMPAARASRWCRSGGEVIVVRTQTTVTSPRSSASSDSSPAVIAGHVDNTSGLLVFWNLRLLKPGDRVETEPGNLVFTVTSVTQVSKDAFPTAQVYGPVKDPQLRLITRGGAFDQATGHYLDHVIVYARPRRGNGTRRRGVSLAFSWC
jgi:hypothetical protein